MENLPIKILDVEFAKNCPSEFIEPAKCYFELNDQLQFVNKTGFVQDKYGIDYKGMQALRNNASLKYKMLCDDCDSWKTQTASSHQQFQKILRHLKRYNLMARCQECDDLYRKKQSEISKKFALERKKIQEKEHQKRIQKLNSAVNDKAWRKLSTFQFKVLKDCLTFDSFDELKQFYWYNNPTKSGYKKFFKALQMLASKDLIITETKFDHQRGYNIITNFKYLDRLKREFEYNFELEDNSEDKNNSKQKSKNKDCTNNLKLRLTINDYNHHPDSPLYAGTIRFKEKIVINPNVDYTFAQWERHNDELYFTLVPTSEIEKLPVQKKLSQEPKAVQEHITNFLNNIKVEK